MAKIDDIFTSDLSENKKKSKMLFGRLLLSMRRNNRLRLYSLMSEIFDTDFVENKLILFIGEKTTYEMMNNKADVDIINQELAGIETGVVCEFQFSEQKKFDKFQFEEFLKKEFGRILTIK